MRYSGVSQVMVHFRFELAKESLRALPAKARILTAVMYFSFSVFIYSEKLLKVAQLFEIS